MEKMSGCWIAREKALTTSKVLEVALTNRHHLDNLGISADIEVYVSLMSIGSQDLDYSFRFR